MVKYVTACIGFLLGDGVITMFPYAPGWCAWLCCSAGAAFGYYYGRVVFG